MDERHREDLGLRVVALERDLDSLERQVDLKFLAAANAQKLETVKVESAARELSIALVEMRQEISHLRDFKNNMQGRIYVTTVVVSAVISALFLILNRITLHTG